MPTHFPTPLRCGALFLPFSSLSFRELLFVLMNRDRTWSVRSDAPTPEIIICCSNCLLETSIVIGQNTPFTPVDPRWFAQCMYSYAYLVRERLAQWPSTARLSRTSTRMSHKIVFATSNTIAELLHDASPTVVVHYLNTRSTTASSNICFCCTLRLLLSYYILHSRYHMIVVFVVVDNELCSAANQ